MNPIFSKKYENTLVLLKLNRTTWWFEFVGLVFSRLKEHGGLLWCYKNTEKGQGSEAEIASLKIVRAESVRDLGILLMINYDLQPTYMLKKKKKDRVGGFWRRWGIRVFIYVVGGGGCF